MGYYSGLTACCSLNDRDRSYAAPEEQLLWRLEDLEERLQELAGERRQNWEGCYLPESSLRYILPEDLHHEAHVRAAIALALADLEERYLIRRSPVPEESDFRQVEIRELAIAV